jgi:formylglycine-generating enzyme required for sulfatase activity
MRVFAVALASVAICVAGCSLVTPGSKQKRGSSAGKKKPVKVAELAPKPAPARAVETPPAPPVIEKAPEPAPIAKPEPVSEPKPVPRTIERPKTPERKPMRSVDLPEAAESTAAEFERRYTAMLDKLRAELKAKIPSQNASSADRDRFLASDALDDKLAKFVVLHEGTPSGLAEFAAKGKEQAGLIEFMLSDAALMRQMLVADGAKRGKVGKSDGPAQYGPAMKIYMDIQRSSEKANDGILQRLAMAIALEHAVPISQRNPKADTDAPATVDPVGRYLQYEKAFLAGELDPAFAVLTTWDLRFVVHGNEPDWTLVWGREMCRNYHPEQTFADDYGWKYVNIVRTDVRYGSGDVKYDRPELQFFQNIIMNGGVCGRRAFFGRFMCRAFGIPTTARPSRGHAALAHWTPKGWVVNLGGGWGAGWTKTAYKKDRDFLATTQARANPDEFLKVKRAQWAGDVMGEKRTYGEAETSPAFWNGVSLKTQRAVINASKAQELGALGEELGEANEKSVATAIKAATVSEDDKKISYGDDGVIEIPAAGYAKASNDVRAVKSYAGGLQLFLGRFSPQGVTILRGGAWRGGAEGCKSGARLKSSGYGKYNNWGFRAAMSHKGGRAAPEVSLDLGDGLKMEFVYIKPGSFIMGGENAQDSKWGGVEVPKHKVTITKGFYMGKYEVTQEQFKAITGMNPSKGGKDPKCPADNISEDDALSFCRGVAVKTGQDVRLPTEAEWEYSCRAGSTTAYFFGDTPARLGEYAWYKDNDGGSSHPVGMKKPNPWGLYDILGNVVERVSDRYAKDYYKKSPEKNPTGPIMARKAQLEYKVNVPRAGEYEVTAKVVTVNYSQNMFLSVNGSKEEEKLMMPYTCGKWMDSDPVTVTLKAGENTLAFSRDNPPQYGMAVKSFTLKPGR